MAGYSAVIDLRVNGLEGLRTVSDRIESINRLIKQIKPVPTLFDVRGSAELKAAKQDLDLLVKKYADGGTQSARFSSSIAGLNQQLITFRAVAANAKVGSDQFTNAIKAAEFASGRLAKAEIERLNTLNSLYTRQATGRLTAGEQGPSLLTKEVLNLGKTLPTSIAGLRSYASELDRVFALVEAGSIDFRTLQAEIARVNKQLDVATGAGPLQGPALPPGMQGGGTKRGLTSPIGGGKGYPGSPGAKSAMFENLALGAGFPLLFGGGAGQVAGGLLGSFVGTGFGGQILGSAIGQQLEDALRRISDIGKATQTLNLDTLRDSVIAVNAGLDITVERLIKAGQANAARAEIGKQVALQTGLLPEATEGTAQAVSALSTAWNEVVGAVSGLLSLLGRPFVTALAVILQGIAKAAQGMNILIQLMQKYIPGIAIANKLWAEIEKRLPKIAEDQEQLKAELERQTDAYSRQLNLSMKLEDIDKRRNKGNSVAAKINNNELDRQTKITKLRDDTEKKIQDERLKFKGKDISLLEEQIKAEAAIEERTINREAARQRERLELEKALGIIKATLTAETARVEQAAAIREQDLRLVQSQVNLYSELEAIETSRLQKQSAYSLSLNETSAIIDKVAISQENSARLTEENARVQADNSIQQAADAAKIAEHKAFAAQQEWLALGRAGDLTEEKKAELQAIIDQEPIAKRNLEITRITAHETKLAATARLEHQQYTIELERREQQVAAYAKELAIETQKAARAAEEHLAKVENSARRVTSFADAYITINNVQKAILETALKDAQTTGDKRALIQQIYELEIANAKLALESSKAQIAADIERQRILLRNAELKYEELRATTLLAKAQGVVTREHYLALDAQASALRIAQANLKTTQQVATYQTAAAEAVYRGAVFAAQTTAKQRLGDVNTGTTRGLQAFHDSNVSSFASGGYVTGPTRAVIGEGGESEYVIPTSKMDEAMSRYAQGRRGSSVIPSSINPQVNVTTGPVMNMDGRNYVSQNDFMAGMQTASRRGAEMALEALQNNGSIRRMAGVG